MFVNRKCLKAISSVKTKIFETIFRSSCLERFYKKGVLEKYSVLKNFTKFTGKHLCQSLFFNNVTGQGPPTLLKKSLWHRCFPVNFAKFLRTPILQNISGGLFLTVPVTPLIYCNTLHNHQIYIGCECLSVLRNVLTLLDIFKESNSGNVTTLHCLYYFSMKLTCAADFVHATFVRKMDKV